MALGSEEEPSGRDGLQTTQPPTPRTMIDDRQGTPMTAAARVHRHRRLLPYAAALVAAATLGSCSGGDPGPATTAPPVTSTAATTTTAQPTTMTPTPTATVDPVIAKIPAAARSHSRAGAEAFGRFYMEQVNQAFTQADPNALVGLARPTCKTCSSFLAGAKELRAKGIHHQGVSITVEGSPANAYSSNRAVIQIFVTQHSVPVVDKENKKVDQTKAGEGILIATLAFEQRWVMERLQVAK